MSDVGSHKWALVIAHPGHELRVFHFLERARPIVSILTDGSGFHGAPRLHDTTALLGTCGATREQVYGCLTDTEAYSRLMAGDDASFVEIARRLSRSFDEHGVTAVLTDAAEGYNPVHDLCRVIAETAARLCRVRTPLLFEVDLVGHPDGNGPGIRLHLDDEAFVRKLNAVNRYAALTTEAAAAFDRHGADAFRVEFLRQSATDVLPSKDHVPYYEVVGQERVREGRYASVLRYSTHVRPVLAALLAATALSAASFQ
jgi:hypothetical protein